MNKFHSHFGFNPGLLPILVFVSILIAPAAAAESQFLLEIGLGGGGERIQPSTSEANVNAGAGISVATGVEFFLNEDKRQSLSVSYGVILSLANSGCAFCVRTPSDATVYFETYALNLIYQKNISDDAIGPIFDTLFYHWVGIGLSHHLNSKYEFRNMAGFADATLKFDDPTGLVLQYSLRTAGAGQVKPITADFGIRHIFMEYDSGQSSFDASNTFLFWNVGF